MKLKSCLRYFYISLFSFSLVASMLSQQVQPVYADRTDCATPGNDGPVTISANNTIVNTYFPGTANANAGNTSITIGGYSGANVGIQPGDLLLVIQMQGANINPNNDNTYGAGTGSGNGNLNDANFTAGQYEYVVATNTVPTAGGTLNINTQLMFSYSTRNFTAGSQGQRRFQVIRVPQYSSLTITAAGTLTAFSWNGNVGGIVAIDVAGALNLTNNATNGNINVNGQGFRGGGGVTGGGRAGTLATDYSTISPTPNGSKGEGIAGTPRYIFTGAAVTDQGVALEGYPPYNPPTNTLGGTMARGAPGNAGGGGTDANPTTNDQNAGGGGGGNGGAGGKGGFSWSTYKDTGGIGGAAFPAAPNRLVLGGGEARV